MAMLPKVSMLGRCFTNDPFTLFHLSFHILYKPSSKPSQTRGNKRKSSVMARAELASTHGHEQAGHNSFKPQAPRKQWNHAHHVGNKSDLRHNHRVELGSE